MAVTAEQLLERIRNGRSTQEPNTNNKHFVSKPVDNGGSTEISTPGFDGIQQSTESGSSGNESAYGVKRKTSRSTGPGSIRSIFSNITPEKVGGFDREEKSVKPTSKKQLSKVLSEKEAAVMEIPIANLLKDFFKDLDQYILSATNTSRPIWSEADEDECRALSRVFLRLGRTNEYAASALRLASERDDFIVAGGFFFPAAYETQLRFKEHRKLKKNASSHR